MPTVEEINWDVLPDAAPATDAPAAPAKGGKKAEEIDWDVLPDFVPRQPTALGEFGRAAVAPFKALAKSPQLLLDNEDELYTEIVKEHARQQSVAPGGVASKAGQITGGLAGGIAEFVGATAAASETGPAAPFLGPGIVFGATGSWESAMSAGVRALNEGKSKSEVVRIARQMAGAGGAVGAATAIGLGATSLIPKTATALARTLGTAAIGAGVGGGGQVVENLAEKSMGLDVSPIEGVLEQAVIMGLLPVVAHAKDLYRQARGVAATDLPKAKALQKEADAVAEEELKKAGVPLSPPAETSKAPETPQPPAEPVSNQADLDKAAAEANKPPAPPEASGGVTTPPEPSPTPTAPQGEAAPPVPESSPEAKPSAKAEVPPTKAAPGETGAATAETKRLVHGGTGVFTKGKPIWFSESEDVAGWYAGERGGKAPNIVHADVTIKKPASVDDLRDAAKTVGATQKDIAKGMGQPNYEEWMIDSPLDYVYVPKVINELRRRGFDGAVGWDTLENTELKAYIPFDPSQVKEVGRKPYIEKGQPNASSIEKTAEVHGDVQSQSVEGVRKVPVEEGGTGVQPSTDASKPEPPAQQSPPKSERVLGTWPESQWAYAHLKDLTMGQRADRARFLGMRTKDGMLELSSKKLADRAKQRFQEIAAEKKGETPQIIAKAGDRVKSGSIEGTLILDAETGAASIRTDAGSTFPAVLSKIEPVTEPVTTVPLPEDVAKDIGWTVKANDLPGISTEGMDAAMLAKLREKYPRQWEFTDRRPGSKSEGITFYVPEGSTREEILAAHDAKMKAFGPLRKDVGPMPEVVPPPVRPEKMAKVTETPVKAAAKAGKEIKSVANAEGQKSAKDVKAELLKRIEDAMHGAPEKNAYKASEHGVVEINIPGDGKFKIPRNLAALGEMRDRVSKLDTKSTTKRGTVESDPTAKAQRTRALKPLEVPQDREITVQDVLAAKEQISRVEREVKERGWKDESELPNKLSTKQKHADSESDKLFGAIHEALQTPVTSKTHTIAEGREFLNKRLGQLEALSKAEPEKLSAIPTGEGHTIEGARAEAEKAFRTLSDRVSFVHEPDNPSAAYTDRNKIVVNAAKVAPGTVEKVMLEEGLHGVWKEPAVQDAWKSFRNGVTEYEIAAERAKRKGLDTSRETLKEEAAISKLLNNPEAPLAKRVWDAIIAALDRVFGVKVGDDRATLLEAAREFLSGDRSTKDYVYDSPYRPVMSISQSLPTDWKLIGERRLSTSKPIPEQLRKNLELVPLDPNHPENIKKRYGAFRESLISKVSETGTGNFLLKNGDRLLLSENVDPHGSDKYPFRITRLLADGRPAGHEVFKDFDEVSRYMWMHADDIVSDAGNTRFATPTTGRAPIEQYTEALKGVKGEKAPLSERFKEAFDIGSRMSTAKDALGKAFSGLKATGDWIADKFEGVENIDDLLREKGLLSKSTETRGWQTHKWEREAKRAVPRARDQAAVRKWVDAGGDEAELRRGMAETKPQYRQAYEDALNLSPDLLKAAQETRKYFERMLDEAIDAGVLEQGVEDYIHRMYESRPEEARKALAYVQSGILKANPAMAKKRIFAMDWEAEKAGFRPVQSFIPAVAEYETSLSRAIAARRFIGKATTMLAPDGRPVVDIKGVGIPIENQEGERTGTLIKPQFNPSKANKPGTPNYRADYVNKEFPALSKWKWVSADSDGKPIFVQGDVAIHPDFVHRINALLEPSQVRYGRYGAILRPALAIGSAFKQTMLDLSMFHQVQIAVHGLEHKVNPFNLVKDIDFQNPNVEGLLKGGVTLGGDYRYNKEGLVGSSLTRQIPILGPALESYHQWLFQDFIPRVKMTMALKAMERNRGRYPEMSEEQIFQKTASQANAAFGELNYVMMERSKTTQDIARLIMLAPDFLEARGRFAAEALSRGGKRFGNEQRTALLLGALTLYTAARALNKATDDQYHFEPENAFSWVHKGQAYSLRTVQGDILHLIDKPLNFWMHRLNPLYSRTLLEAVTQRDSFGRKRSATEMLWDTVSTAIPISLRTSRERTLWESMVNAFGITDRRWQDTDDAFKMAKKWKAAHGVGERGEFIYDPEKDPLRGLKVALSHQDDAGAAVEIQKLIQSKAYTMPKLDQYFQRYSTMPFTGSRANDIKWQADLSEDEKKTVEAAKEHKKAILQLYRKAKGQLAQVSAGS